MNPSESTSLRRQLRSDLRNRRSQLSDAQQQSAARHVYRLLIHHPVFLRARHIAFYFASDGELDPLPLMLASLEMGKDCYLPVLSRHRPNQVSFAPFTDEVSLQANRWGIPEPVAPITRLVSPRAIDLVLVPLVGFDDQGGRLGMGKGFYDRTFCFRIRSGLRRPRLLGLAHECQRVDRIPMAPWDVRLDAVASDRQIYWPT